MGSIIDLFKSGVYGLFIFLGIKTGVVEILFYMMIIDSVLGIAKALKLGDKFSFKFLMWGMVSKLSLLIVPMILALMAKALNLDFNYFVITVINVLIVNEGISCITNIITIKTGNKIENTDYVTTLLNAIRKLLMSIIQKAINTIECAKFDNSNKK